MGESTRGRGGGKSGCGTSRKRQKQQPWLWHDCETASLAHHNVCTVGEKGGVTKKKFEKEPWECSCAADLPFKKFWGDNKYSNDSSVPLHPRLKLTRGPNVECQQQTQRSELWGAEAATTAWLNGAGDFPSPPLPSRHSQSLLGKSGARPASQAASEWKS